MQVEKNGEAWYFEPGNENMYYLGRPADAFQVMRERALGVSNLDFKRIEEGKRVDLQGRILLKVEDEGRAYYYFPGDNKLHYLGRPVDAFRIMRELGLGISEKDFAMLRTSNIKKEKKVPFTSQAPSGDWSNPRFQDGCEEASALMAMAWVQGREVDISNAEAEILELSFFAEKEHGEYRDQSIDDTARLIRDFYKYKNYEIKEGTIEDVISALQGNHLVIMPFNGQKLGNPFFTPPGPINHMALVHAYDETTGEFVVNDPGTRNGRNYKYKKEIIDQAWREFPTGYHEEILEEKKRMIVVWSES